MIKSTILLMICMYLSKLYISNKFNKMKSNMDLKLNKIEKKLKNSNKEKFKNKEILSIKTKEQLNNKKPFKLKNVKITNSNLYEPFNNKSNCYNYLKLK